eukprot:13185251-Ditylum_brightwellii.AAC.1
MMISHDKDSSIYQCLVRVWPSRSSRMRGPFDTSTRSPCLDYMYTLIQCSDGAWRVDAVLP